MNPDELDRILSREAEIVPSAGFSRSVMAAVRNEVTAPPPIAFPWKMALPGLAACGVAILQPLTDAFRIPVRESASVATSSLSQLTQWMNGAVPLLDKAQMLGAGWVLLGLLLTFAGLKLTWHLAGGKV